MKKNIISLFCFLCLIVAACSGRNSKLESKASVLQTQLKTVSTTLGVWDSVHAVFSARDYSKIRDGWDYSGFCHILDYNDKDLQTLYNMKVETKGRDALSLNGHVVHYYTDTIPARFALRTSVFYSDLDSYFANKGISLKHSVPTICFDSCADKSFDYMQFTDEGKNVFVKDYLVLYKHGIAAIYKYKKKHGQGIPDAKAHLEYTTEDLYKDAGGKQASVHAQKYGIKRLEEKCDLVDGALINDDIQKGDWYIAQLPLHNSHQIIICLNVSGDTDECMLFVMKNHRVDCSNSIELAPVEGCGDGDTFAVFSDGTIYVRSEGVIKAYRINSEGEFYKLE